MRCMECGHESINHVITHSIYCTIHRERVERLNFPDHQHEYSRDDDFESPDYGYCDKCGMELHAVDINQTQVHSNTGLPERLAVDLSAWQSWRDANMPGGE